MTESLHHLVIGFGVALSLQHLVYCLIGVTLGTLIGVLPGLGPSATIAMLLPFTFNLPASAALIMLAGIYYGAQYGGSTTAILLRLPGESSSVVTCLDGYEMARQGRAGPALATAALGSFFAGCVSTLIVVLFAPPLSRFALAMGSAEYFSLMFFGLLAAVVVAQGSVLKAIAMLVLGLLLGLVGIDPDSGIARYSFNIPEFADGISLVALAMGLFGLADIVANLEVEEERSLNTSRVQGLIPTWADFKAAWRPTVRGTLLGSAIGILPGGSATLSSFASYALEKRIARDPSRFGKGAIEGVAGPESANNAAAQCSFIPMLTLGLPSNVVMAMMLGALLIQGIVPGPQALVNQPQLFWGLIVSMWIGNLFLLVLNLPLIGVWVRLLMVPYYLLYPAILLFISIGAYSLHNSAFDVAVTAAFGLIGYVFVKLDCEPAPLLLGFVLGPMMEDNLRRALVLSRGDWSVFVTRPISATFLALAILLLASMSGPAIWRTLTGGRAASD